MDAIDFLIHRNILRDRNLDKKFPLNLTRDCHIKSANDFVQAMEDYHKHKLKEIDSQTEATDKVSWNPVKK